MKFLSVFLFSILICLSFAIFASSTLELPVVEIREMTITAYSPSKRQTQGDPFVTASTERVSIESLHGIHNVAVSRDLLKQFTEGAVLEYGDSIFIEFIVLDTMNARYTNRVDIFFRNKELAFLFGSQKRRVIIVKSSIRGSENP